MKNILHVLILLVAGFAIYGSFGLVIEEWNTGNICPKILNIPACYMVWVCFTLAFFAHLIPSKKSTWLYFISVGIVTLIASTGTIGELTETAKCPQTAGGTPMCFISLAICLSLLILKIGLFYFKKLV